MQAKMAEMVRWFVTIWTESDDGQTQTFRRHVRGLIVGWAVTAVAMALVEVVPNEAKLSMYDVLRTQGLPWQQHVLAAIELAAPLLMAWHLNGLRLWGKRRFVER